MTRRDFAKHLHTLPISGRRLPVDVIDALLDALGQEVRRALASGDVAILPGVGTIIPERRAAREYVGREGRICHIPACIMPRFKASPQLKASLRIAEPEEEH